MFSVTIRTNPTAMLEFAPMEQLDYLLIGHITCDLLPDGEIVGGTVAYSGRVAKALGYKTAVLTSCHPSYHGLSALDGMEVEVIPSENTSTFENVYTTNGRIQTLHHVAKKITAADVPVKWPDPAIVHLAPLTNEVDPAIIRQFPNSIIGLTPQGWMRQWDENGRITAKPWQDAAKYIPFADVVILSQEDLLTPNMVFDYWDWSNILVITCGPKGAIVFQEDRAEWIPTIEVQEVEATGAGDVFAAAYLFRYHQTKDPIEAARFANIIASYSVTQTGVDNIEEIIREKYKTYG